MNYSQTNPVKYEELSNSNKVNHSLKCPKCFGLKFWQTGDNRLKCKNCRKLFKPKPNPFNLSNQILNKVIAEFILGHSTNIILERINISKYKLLKMLTLLRILMTKDIPEVLRKIIKAEDYLNNQKRKLQDLNGDIKHPIIGIFCKEGGVYAKILPNLEISDLKLFLKEQKRRNIVDYPSEAKGGDEGKPEGVNFIDYSEDWQKYIGLVFRDSLYRLFPLKGKKHRLDAMEGFWGYLKRKLAAKGGVRKEKLPLYIGEYVWRYNHRKLALEKQEKLLLNLVSQCFGSEN
jgi:hypothetical protein